MVVAVVVVRVVGGLGGMARCTTRSGRPVGARPARCAGPVGCAQGGHPPPHVRVDRWMDRWADGLGSLLLPSPGRISVACAPYRLASRGRTAGQAGVRVLVVYVYACRCRPTYAGPCCSGMHAAGRPVACGEAPIPSPTRGVQFIINWQQHAKGPARVGQGGGSLLLPRSPFYHTRECAHSPTQIASAPSSEALPVGAPPAPHASHGCVWLCCTQHRRKHTSSWDTCQSQCSSLSAELDANRQRSEPVRLRLDPGKS